MRLPSPVFVGRMLCLDQFLNFGGGGIKFIDTNIDMIPQLIPENLLGAEILSGCIAPSGSQIDDETQNLLSLKIFESINEWLNTFIG